MICLTERMSEWIVGKPDVGYLDALASSLFKTAPDGRKVFFPLGLGRGYAIVSEHDYRRLKQQIKIYMVSLVLLLGLATPFRPHGLALPWAWSCA
jgi:hypothetical protein